jgi:hypothetical protein
MRSKRTLKGPTGELIKLRASRKQWPCSGASQASGQLAFSLQAGNDSTTRSSTRCGTGETIPRAVLQVSVAEPEGPRVG